MSSLRSKAFQPKTHIIDPLHEQTCSAPTAAALVEPLKLAAAPLADKGIRAASGHPANISLLAPQRQHQRRLGTVASAGQPDLRLRSLLRQKRPDALHATSEVYHQIRDR